MIHAIFTHQAVEYCWTKTLDLGILGMKNASNGMLRDVSCNMIMYMSYMSVSQSVNQLEAPTHFAYTFQMCTAVIFCGGYVSNSMHDWHVLQHDCSGWRGPRTPSLATRWTSCGSHGALAGRRSLARALRAWSGRVTRRKAKGETFPPFSPGGGVNPASVTAKKRKRTEYYQTRKMKHITSL